MAGSPLLSASLDNILNITEFEKEDTDHSNAEDVRVDDRGDVENDHDDHVDHESDDGWLTVTSLQGDRLESLEKVRLHFLNSFWGGIH